MVRSIVQEFPCRVSGSIAIVALIACGLAGCGSGKQGGGPPQGGTPEVGVVTIEPQQAVLTAELPGRTLPYEVSDVRPQVNGILKKRLFTEGSIVQAGQPLYQIDDTLYQAAYSSAKAQLANAKAGLTTAKLRADRYISLREQKSISQQDYDDAQAALQQAMANVEQQQANVESARITLGYTRITAPITGKIGRSYLTQGALVEANQDQILATIQTLDPIYVDMNQSSSELLALRRAVAEDRPGRRDHRGRDVDARRRHAYPQRGHAAVSGGFGRHHHRHGDVARAVSEPRRRVAAGHVRARDASSRVSNRTRCWYRSAA